MAKSEIIKTLNGRKVYDEDARKELEKIKNAAPGLVFDTVADMEAYVAANAGTLKVGQDLFIRAADVPDYWWDGTQAVPVKTDLTEVRNELDQLSAAIVEQGKTIPKVFDWANAELPFTENEISGVASGGGFVVNPTNFADGKTYFRYNAGASDGFRWTNPNTQKGSLTITMRGYSQYSETLRTKIVTVYTDGTDNSLTDIMYLTHGNTVTYTTDPYKTVDYIRGNYDFEDWVLLDMDVLSIVADYPAPTGTVKSVNGNLPDENGNVVIDIPEGGDLSDGVVVRPPDIYIAVEDEGTELSEIRCTEVAGKPIQATKLTVFAELPANAGEFYYPAIYNTTLPATGSIAPYKDKCVHNFNFTKDSTGELAKDRTHLFVVRKIDSRNYICESWKNAKMRDGSLDSGDGKYQISIFPNIMDEETFIKSFVIVAVSTSKIKKGARISIWLD